MLLDIYNSKKEFLKEYEYFCFHNNYKQILDFYKVENSECYIDTTIGVSMDLVEKDNDISIDISYNIDKSSLLEPYNKNVIHSIPYENNSEKNIIELKKKNDNGIPVITFVDVYYLPYMPYYKEQNSIHSVIMCGYNNSKEEINIVDWYKPYFYSGTIKEREFLLARSSANPKGMFANSGYPVKNTWVEINNEHWDADVNELLMKTLFKYEVNYYNSQYYSGECCCSGFQVLKTLLEALRKIKYSDESIIKKFLEDLHRNLFHFPKYIEFLTCYINRSLKKLNYDKFTNEMDQLNEQIKRWDDFLRLIIKTSIVFSNDKYEKIIEKFIKLIINEESIYEMSVKIKNNL